MLDAILHFLQHGLLSPSISTLAWYTLVTFALSLLSISCYLHRSQTHRSVFFIWPVALFFRINVWLLTATVTKEWVAIHRKHHAKCDTEEDPHSPKYFGLKKILREGADIYHKLAKNSPEILEEYGEGTPNDWLERNIFSKGVLGIMVLLGIQLVLFGFPGLVIWSFQMLIQPILAAGFINGITHVYGYQTYKDGEQNVNGKPFNLIGEARNVPTYILAFGEEFHNNHHAYQGWYKFSHRWFEFDVAGTFIELLTWIGFAWVPKKR